MKQLGQIMPHISRGTAEQDNGTALVTAQRQAEVVAQRMATLSPPEWVALRAKWTGATVWSETESRSVIILPSSFAPLTDRQRAGIDRLIGDLELIVRPEQFAVAIGEGENIRRVTADQAKLITITKMMMSLASAAMSSEQAEAKGEAYLHVVRYAPAWSVREAVERWWDGKAKGVKDADFTWHPAPKVFGDLVKDVLEPYDDLHGKLCRVRDARRIEDVHL